MFLYACVNVNVTMYTDAYKCCGVNVCVCVCVSQFPHDQPLCPGSYKSGLGGGILARERDTETKGMMGRERENECMQRGESACARATGERGREKPEGDREC